MPSVKSRCSIKDCNNVVAKKGMCNAHYIRWYRHGDPNILKLVKGRPDYSFWLKVDKNGPIHPVHGQCWIWIGMLSPDTGYGRQKIKGICYSTHRRSWEIHFGPIPDGKWVLHKCDNQPCVNPSHLFLGNFKDNVDDMIQKGRQVKGERQHSAKLSVDQVVEIRARYVPGDPVNGARPLGRSFKVNGATIKKCADGVTWKHVDSGCLFS